ncbi:MULTISPECIES: DUF488 family protein [unclassified Rhizobium]|uniref:DUF488 domain-containing protein n=1 Tax=unclassified Rhizobium TaxID=2613769 RepID=UPI0037F98313
MKSLPFFTIGHSNRSFPVFLELLREAEVERLIDIRKIPMSRANPQFNKDALSIALSEAQVSYEHIAALGGLRGNAKTFPTAMNGLWTNESFHNYADYALTAPFQENLQHLLEEGHKQRSAIMCSEAVWWRCHRRIVADYLIARGETVFHIMGSTRIEPARLTSGARLEDDGTVTYPAPLQDEN